MNDVVIFGKLVRARRVELRFTQEALAAAALGNFDRKGYISSVENGKKPGITKATVQKICEVLEISLSDVPTTLQWESTSTRTPKFTRPAYPISDEGVSLQSNARFYRQIVGICVLGLIVVFSASFSEGLAHIFMTIWSDGNFEPLVFFGWALVFGTVVFFVFGLEGRGAYTRAAWLEQGTWRNLYLKSVNEVLDRLDRFFSPNAENENLELTSFRRNWSVGLFEKTWALAIIYPSTFLLLQWTFTGSGQQLGFLQIWPQEPDIFRRFLICFCFLVAIPLVKLARHAPNRVASIAYCGVALAFNYAAMSYIWITYWNVLVGPGALNLICVVFILGAGLRVFRSVTHAAAAAAIAGASVSILFIPILRVSEKLTGRIGYNDPIVNTTHAAMNHSLMLALFLGAFVVLKPAFRGQWPWSQSYLHVVVSVATAALMLLASTQEFWFPYYLLIGIFPFVNALFDFASIGLTRYALRLGANSFGLRTLAFSTLDLIIALTLFVALVLVGAMLAQMLNALLGGAFIPIKIDALSCIEASNSSLSAETLSAVKGIANLDTTCSRSVLKEVLSAPQDNFWLIATFGSTLLPTLIHLAFALFAFGPAIITDDVRKKVVEWSKGAAHDPFLRGGASLFFGAWLACVLTLTFWALHITGKVFTGDVDIFSWLFSFVNF